MQTITREATGPAASARRLVLLHGAREMAIVLAIYVAYSAVRSLSGDAAQEAVARAQDIIHFEVNWGINWEPDIQSWTLGYKPLIHAANFVYFWLHLPLLLVFAPWMFFRSRKDFNFLRNVWVISQLIGIFFFLLYPVAPPRLLPNGYGFVDTLTMQGPFDYTSAEAGVLMNKYAAFPSLHFAWSFIIAVGLHRTLPWRWARIAVLGFPLLSFWAIVATANHYVADALAGGLVAAASFALAVAGERLWRAYRLRRQAGEAARSA